MSREASTLFSGATIDEVLCGSVSHGDSKVAREISTQAIELARRARAAGMTTLALMLEAAALEAAVCCQDTPDACRNP
jgi:propanediol dehydratase small subunit